MSLQCYFTQVMSLTFLFATDQGVAGSAGAPLFGGINGLLSPNRRGRRDDAPSLQSPVNLETRGPERAAGIAL